MAFFGSGRGCARIRLLFLVVFWWSEHPLGPRARALGCFFGGLLVERAPVRYARARALGFLFGGVDARVRLLFGVVSAR